MAGRPLDEYRRKRDFSRTPEPEGSENAGPGSDPEGTLCYMMHKHDARNLHFDLRLELDGVMKSWAVPKGPTLDPEVRRLAIHVEDHPLEYNRFEGVIAEGEYGGGTVMIWDRGSWCSPDDDSPDAALKSLRKGYRAGRLTFILEGGRLRGLFHLIRTGRNGGGERGEQWLWMKGDDDFAEAGDDITARETTSVATGRTMAEIAAEEESVSFAAETRRSPGSSRPPPRPSLPDFRPMLAHTAESPPAGPGWVFEPKYDGIRILAVAATDSIALVTRNGRDKARQFPEIVDALRDFVSATGRPVVLDGEIVATREGTIARFQELQARMHETGRSTIAAHAQENPAAFVAFDVLLDGEDILLRAPWSERRDRLEELLPTDEQAGPATGSAKGMATGSAKGMGKPGGKGQKEGDGGPRKGEGGGTGDGECSAPRSASIRLGEVDESGRTLLRRARSEGWEGIIAKRADAPYEPGRRSRRWLKVKVENRQEFVVGGFTEPRGSRKHLGALLLGYFDDEGKLHFAGHVGTGFTDAALKAMRKRLEPIARKTPPFAETPKTNQPAHWVTPRIVVEVRFNEWTREGGLRHPVFLGMRDDKDPHEVRREAVEGAVERAHSTSRSAAAPDEDLEKAGKRGKAAGMPGTAGKAPQTGKSGLPRRAAGPPLRMTAATRDVMEQIEKLESGSGGGTLILPEGKKGDARSLAVTNLDKVFFPKAKFTKGDMMRYYAHVSPFLLPLLEDRPLVLKRYPHGIGKSSFYQQNAPDAVPEGVRVETIMSDKGEEQRRFVGGCLTTLLYLVQLGAVSVDPWHSRAGSLDFADYTVIDLDPGKGTPFARVTEVASHVKEELERVGLHGVLKTSGATGLHIFVPMPDGTPNDAAQLVARIIATEIAGKHPDLATVERMTRSRPSGTVYVDFLQNIVGKTVAGAYSIRARPGAPVSTPLSWDELSPTLDPRDFTIATAPLRFEEVGDLWGVAMSRPNSLDTLLEGSASHQSGSGF